MVARLRELLLSAGAYPEETRDQRSRRRVIVGILWFSVFGIGMGALTAEPGPLRLAQGLKTLSHLSALLALWIVPRRIVPVFFAMSVADLAVDSWITVLTGGFYESGLQVLWTVVGAVGLLVLGGVRPTVVILALTAATTVTLIAAGPFEATHPSANPEAAGAFTVTLMLTLVFVALFYFVRQRDRFQRESDDLLHAILPEPIAERLKLGDRMIAESFESATVLFADVVGFTPLSAKLDPTALVELLNDVFAAIDGLVEELGLEKIKTVGDEYMVASGIPEPRSDHAIAAAELAIRMRDLFSTSEFAGHKLDVRIGLNSGPVTAGIIGTHKFAYDLWGDSVNVASRMESTGVPGRIQVTQATCDLIADRYVCEPRGEVEVKGRGLMTTYFLVGRRHGLDAGSGTQVM